MPKTWGKNVDKLGVLVGKNCVRLSPLVDIPQYRFAETWGQATVFRPFFPTFPPSFSSLLSAPSPLLIHHFSPQSTIPIIRAAK